MSRPPSRIEPDYEQEQDGNFSFSAEDQASFFSIKTGKTPFDSRRPSARTDAMNNISFSQNLLSEIKENNPYSMNIDNSVQDYEQMLREIEIEETEKQKREVLSYRKELERKLEKEKQVNSLNI